MYDPATGKLDQAKAQAALLVALAQLETVHGAQLDPLLGLAASDEEVAEAR